MSELTSHMQQLQFQMNRALRPGATDGPRGVRLVADAVRQLHALHRLVIGPMADMIREAHQLTFVPHGPLHVLPFHALHDGERYLVERAACHIVPSASVLCMLRDEPARRSAGSALVVGVADEAAPQIAAEATAVAEAVGGSHTLLTGADATVDRVARNMQNASLVHLACHGRFSPDTPLGSGLKLADRWLTVRDLYVMRLNAELVTLSGCETGVNLVKAGDELSGLIRGFFAAGTTSLMVSLWRVDDQAALDFMTTFYELMRTIDTQNRALAHIVREAQRAVLKRHPHPALWAPFILVGKS